MHCTETITCDFDRTTIAVGKDERVSCRIPLDEMPDFGRGDAAARAVGSDPWASNNAQDHLYHYGAPKGRVRHLPANPVAIRMEELPLAIFMETLSFRKVSL